MKNLVIVESPAKAKTIEKYLGSDFVVKSSIGHIRGLPSKNGSIDVDNNFEPKFEVSADKKKVVAELRKDVKSADTVWLASDEDREGEAIAWHLAETLKLDPKTTRRIVFNEITKKALDNAVANPGNINQELVEAQQARQALDYLVGFELSPVLWRKVGPKLSAGRVQSVAVRLIVERERELENFTAESTFKLEAIFALKDGSELVSEAPVKFKSAAEAEKVLSEYAKSEFSVADISKKPGTRNPSAPFTTSTLQQEASSKLGFSPRNTMSLAQRLYEAGHITYMRTDSLNISGDALSAMTTYIKSEYGENYHQVRTFKTKSSGAQEAHEAIRPTNVTKSIAGADEQQKKLYNLIWRRALASQMAPAQLEKTTMTISASESSQNLEAKGEIVVFDGFLKVYGRSGEDKLLPDINTGDNLDLLKATATENLSRGPARYTEASLVKKLEEMGIGRPSTYASTIATVQTRGYVERGDVEGIERKVTVFTLENGNIDKTEPTVEYGKDSNKLVPTDTGNVVTDFLVKHFSEVMEYDFTKEVEDQLDEIADGNKKRVEVLKNFYGPFHKLVENSADISRADASQSRSLGNDPKSGKPIIARYGRYGAMLQRGEAGDDDNKPDFAPMPTGAKIDTVTLEQALEAFQLPRVVGETEDGKEIKANIGRFGPYIVVDKLFVSIKPLDPHTITLEESRKYYAEKLKAEAEKNIADFGDGIKVLKGRFGPYITDGTKNAKIPKDIEPKSITHEQAKELLAKAPAKKGGRRRVIKKKS
ncbi:MAG: type I DNA topoisomerase [Candidatus Saccharibacteria bacterium]|nr:type I DNA topoisomerase [Candidatus Saccharibacteria bacterium]